jgi:Holliday junction resolvase RusA-like endonuclease
MHIPLFVVPHSQLGRVMTIHMPMKAVGKQIGYSKYAGSFYTIKVSKEFMSHVSAYGKEYAVRMELGPHLVGHKGVLLDVVSYVKVPAAWSKKKKLAALKGCFRPQTKPDGDNVLKCIGDGLNKIMYKDDANIVHIAFDKWYAQNYSVEIEIQYPENCSCCDFN